jgi:hypothetical protein
MKGYTMLKKILLRFACAAAAYILLTSAAFAQDDKLTYVLTEARVRVVEPGCKSVIIKQNPDDPDPACKTIEVLFGKSFPEKAAAENSDNWLVIAVGTDGGRLSVHPQRPEADPLNKRVVLHMNENLNSGGTLDRSTHRIIIVYQQQNLPSVTLGQPQKSGAQKIFTAAKGEKDADIYFKGSATGQRKSGPLYSIEAKAGYLWSLQKAGAIGARATYVSEEGSDVDPDSITASGNYQKIFVISSPWGVILNSDFFGGEFDKKNTTRNLTTELDGTLVLPSKRFGEHTFATMDFMAGFEAGHNFEHPLNPKGLGNFWRPKFGVNAYLVALQPKVFSRVNISASYLLRLPRSAEPFTEKIDGEKVTSLTKRPRHYVSIDSQFMFSPAYGFTVSYRHGSLPPDFKFVDNKVSAGFVLQFKQANK